EKGAALALKGRVLMQENRWSEAVTVYEELIGLDRYIIDPRFKKLFEDEGDNSDEIIFAEKHLEDIDGENVTQKMCVASQFGGYNEMNLFQEYVDKFLM